MLFGVETDQAQPLPHLGRGQAVGPAGLPGTREEGESRERVDDAAAHGRDQQGGAAGGSLCHLPAFL